MPDLTVHPVPPGHVACVITHLEMLAPAAPRPAELPDGATLEHVEAPTPDWYRALYRRLGEAYIWASRLELSDDELTAILHHPDVWVHSLIKDGEAHGLIELDFRQPDECELKYFGVSGPMIGTTAARSMMNAAVALAWSQPITRFWVHTCTFDDQKAVPFYKRSGFVPFAQEFEHQPDPRLMGLLPEDCAPQIPLIRP
ncbi:GNAT family N-acetyltransferase [Chachezhania antarctica]|uniref:GNAT family N-acetyltransferase n=1 Tax=Chachezhania antarctica TaxID=2340860 RepID=UPI000EAE09C3|nr:GNAT family N-acetyltransferase [Chachezhania antarctica]|tara:strand:- start:4701 stop:5297 length:597 start_codon:yes stop_codon:yes gene_type:complete